FIPPLARMLFPGIIDIYIFPVIFLISLLACVLATMLTKPENKGTLKQFYKQTRPWGFWGPIRDEIVKEDPSFVENKDFKRDAFNVAIGIVWQMSMIVMPLYLLTGNTRETIISVLVLVVTSLILKKTWYDHLKKVD
ncbi:MAG TPA: sodium:solute symporter, partial [Mariniflexile sp.]|nr:sodium:solute symporter [Mariniflexile sp.]